MRRCSVAPRVTVVCVAALAIACGRQAPADRAEEDEQPVPVVARPVERGNLRTVVSASGTVTPAPGAEFLVTAPEPARVVDVTKQQGAPVASNEVLVRFELPSAVGEVARLTAERASAEAQLERARLAQTRARDFVGRGLIPRVELDAADRALADAQAEVQKAQTEQAAAEAAAARAVVRAPFDGVVAERLHNPGDLVRGAVTDPVLRIVDPKRLEVNASIEAADVSRVLPGATARLTNPVDGRVIRLIVTPVTSALEPHADGTRPVRLEFAERADNIPVNTRVDVEIDAEERSGVAFIVPDAILRENGATVVLVAAGDRAERRVVTTGVADNERVEITSGLEPGELVITQGHIGLPDGARITAAAGH